MYEPLYLPIMKKAEFLLGNVAYSLEYSNAVKPSARALDELHIHAYTEIFFNVSSDVSFFVNGKLYPVANGEAVISHPNEVHKCVYNSERVHEYFCLWIDANVSSPILPYIPNATIVSFDNQTKEKVFSLLNALNTISNDNENLRKSIIILQILELINNDLFLTPLKSVLPKSFQSILNYISENFNEIKSVQDIATAHYISTATLLRDFKKYLRVSPKKYLEQIKLSNAVEMLNNGFSVTESAINSGFLDVSHFIALFKKKFGVTPHKYKNGN